MPLTAIAQQKNFFGTSYLIDYAFLILRAYESSVVQNSL